MLHPRGARTVERFDKVSSGMLPFGTHDLSENTEGDASSVPLACCLVG